MTDWLTGQAITEGDVRREIALLGGRLAEYACCEEISALRAHCEQLALRRRRLELSAASLALAAREDGAS